MHSPRRCFVATVVAAAGWLLAIPVAIRAAEPVELSGRAMGTVWSVKFIQPVPKLALEEVEQEITDRLEQLEQTFSTFRTQSELSRFNAVDDTRWLPVSPELAYVAGESARISDLTGGAFDATVLPLVQLWGFGATRRAGSVPSTADISAARKLVDWRKLEVRTSPPALRKAQPLLKADFSSMAKGFAADAVGELLNRLGASNHLVQVGGDIKSGGFTAGNIGWHAAIEQPLENNRAVECVLVLTGQALSTSGDYRNFFRVGRLRYGHIIDPRTGQPPVSELASVSVVHASCAHSSALATALFVLGPKAGFQLATREGLACLFILRSGGGLVRLATPEFERIMGQQDRS